MDWLDLLNLLELVLECVDWARWWRFLICAVAAVAFAAVACEHIKSRRARVFVCAPIVIAGLGAGVAWQIRKRR